MINSAEPTLQIWQKCKGDIQRVQHEGLRSQIHILILGFSLAIVCSILGLLCQALLILDGRSKKELRGVIGIHKPAHVMNASAREV